MIDALKAQLRDAVDGLDEAQAEQAATAAIGFFKDKLPGPIGDRLAELVDGDGEGDLDLGGAMDSLKGFLGG